MYVVGIHFYQDIEQTCTKISVIEHVSFGIKMDIEQANFFDSNDIHNSIPPKNGYRTL